jgi:hypothetical protein
MNTQALNSRSNTVACVGALVAGSATGLGICAMALAAGASLGAALLTAASGGLALGLVAGLLLWLIMRGRGAVEGVTHQDPVPPADPSVHRPEAVDADDQHKRINKFFRRWKNNLVKELSQDDFCEDMNLQGVCRGAALVWLKARLSHTTNEETWGALGDEEAFWSQAQKIQAFYKAGSGRQAPSRFARIGAQPLIFGREGTIAAPAQALQALGLQNGEKVDLATDRSLVDLVQKSPVGSAVEIALMSENGGHAVAALRIEGGVAFFDANFGSWELSDEEWAEFLPDFRQECYPDYCPFQAIPMELAASARPGLGR